MKVGEKGGAINVLAKVARPFFRRLFPEVPAEHPAHGSIIMNFAANMLGLDNAATPLGLKAMQELQELNPEKDTATNAQIMFLVLNTSGLTVIPISIMTYRAQLGAANPLISFRLLTTYRHAGRAGRGGTGSASTDRSVILAYWRLHWSAGGALWYCDSAGASPGDLERRCERHAFRRGPPFILMGFQARQRL
jgi:hypothetical protein